MSNQVGKHSGEEVPVVQLCSLSLAELHLLDPTATKDFSTLLAVLAAGENEKAWVAALQIGKLLEIGPTSSIQAVIEAGGVDILHKAMLHTDESIRSNAIWALINLIPGSSQRTSTVLKCGCVPTLVRLLHKDESREVKKRVLWALEAIAAESAFWRDQLLEAGGLTAISAIVSDRTYLKKACKVVLSIVRGRPSPQPIYKSQADSFLLAHLSLENGLQTNCDLLCGLNHITDYSGLSQAHCQLLVRLVESAEVTVIVPALHTISRILAETDTYTDILVESGLLEILKELLYRPQSATHYGVSWFLCDITTHSIHIVDIVVLSGLISPAISAFHTDTSDIKTQMIETLANVCISCSPYLIPQILAEGIASPLIEALSFEDNETVSKCIEGLAVLIQFSKEDSNPKMLNMHMNVEELAEKCRKLANEGLSAAQGLLKEADWLLSGTRKLHI